MTEEDFDALWTDLVHRSHNNEVSQLSEHERYFHAVNLLRGSVLRSGFIGYFDNFSSTVVDAHEGLRMLDLQPVLILLQKAQKTVFGDSLLPSDSSLKWVFPDSLTEEEYERKADQLDESLTPIEQEFYKYDDEIWTALCNFAETHNLKPNG